MNGTSDSSPPESGRRRERETKEQWLLRMANQVKEDQQKSNPNARFTNGDTILHAFVKYECPKGISKAECITKLLTIGADPNALDWDGNTALMIACASTQLPAIKVLGNSPAALLDAQDRDGNSALFHAITSKSLTVVELVLNAAYPKERYRMLTQRNNMGQSPRQFADQIGLPHIAEFIDKEKDRAAGEVEALQAESRANSARAVTNKASSNNNLKSPNSTSPGRMSPRSGGGGSPSKSGGGGGGGGGRQQAHGDDDEKGADRMAEHVVVYSNVNKARKRFLSLVGLFQNHHHNNNQKDKSKEKLSTP